VLPSERVVFPSRAAFTPEPALAWPLIVEGGQSLAQAPEQVLIVPVSFSNR
jgi:hypothetical protein